MIVAYHATSEKAWEEIQREGILHGVRNAPSRCTYLSLRREDCEGKYGDVLLEVEFHPEVDIPHNYTDQSWQVRVYAPIPISRVRKM